MKRRTWILALPLLGGVACADIWGFDDLTLGPDASVGPSNDGGVFPGTDGAASTDGSVFVVDDAGNVIGADGGLVLGSDGGPTTPPDGAITSSDDASNETDTGNTGPIDSGGGTPDTGGPGVPDAGNPVPDSGGGTGPVDAAPDVYVQPPCDAVHCGGCCNAVGKCIGTTTTTCGVSGQSCTDCSGGCKGTLLGAPCCQSSGACGCEIGLLSGLTSCGAP